ncbi:AAA family ATPase [Fredinandcohnia humi]
MKDLNQLIGLKQMKEEIKTLINLIKVQQTRMERGLKSVSINKHLVFTGNPGTGKTTVARLLGKIYKELGVLDKGHVVEVDREKLVAGYTGQTAIKTSELIEEAMGGILFIDEAYSLVDDSFGQEAIATILTRMENHKDEFVLIVAGYPNKMEEFLKSNEGLASRFNKFIHFEDYTGEELVQIFKKFCKDGDYVLEKEADGLLKEYTKQLYNNRNDVFSNGRTMRNLFETTVMKQANRIVIFIEDEEVENKVLKQIIVEDLPFSNKEGVIRNKAM